MLLQAGRCGGKEGLSRIRQTHQEPFIHFTAHGRGLFFLLLQHLQEPLCFSNCWRNEAKSLFWCKFPWMNPAIHSMDNFIFSESSTGAMLGAGWLTDTEKWNSMAPIVKCCSSREEEQPTDPPHQWAAPVIFDWKDAGKSAQCKFSTSIAAWSPSTSVQRSEGKISLLPCQGPVGELCVSLCSPQGFQSRGGRRTLPNYPFTLCSQNLLGVEKSGLGTPNHTWTWILSGFSKLFPNLNCISSCPDTCIEMYWMC